MVFKLLQYDFIYFVWHWFILNKKFDRLPWYVLHEIMIADSLQKIDLMAYCIRRKFKWIMVTQFSATELFAGTNHVEVSLQTKQFGFHPGKLQKIETLLNYKYTL